MKPKRRSKKDDWFIDLINKVIRSLLFAIFFTAGAIVSFFLIAPTLFLISIPSERIIRARRRVISYVSGVYFEFASILLRYLGGTRIFIYSDSPKIFNDSGVLILSNHRTRIDWMFSGWCYASITGLIPELRFILKESLRYVPLFGWSMQLMLYIFLKRKRDSDISHIHKMLNYLVQIGPKPNIFLFPEGTDLSMHNKQLSNRYAAEKGLLQFNYVLHPKPSGFVECVNVLRGYGMVIHDVTIAYKDHSHPAGVRPSEFSILLGYFPKEVHICVNRIEIDTLPLDRAALSQWLYERFIRKEALLAAFYENDCRPVFSPLSTSVTNSPKGDLTLAVTVSKPQLRCGGDGGDRPSSLSPRRKKSKEDLLRLAKTSDGTPDTNISSSSAGDSTGINICFAQLHWPSLVCDYNPSLRPAAALATALFAMVLLVATVTAFRWFLAGIVILFISARVVGGFDSVELALHGFMILDDSLGPKPSIRNSKSQAQLSFRPY